MRKSNSDEKGIVTKFATLFVMTILTLSLQGLVLTGALTATLATVPSVAAANGVGEVRSVALGDIPDNMHELDRQALDDGEKPVITELVEKDWHFRIHNDGILGEECIDEIIITFPDDWTGHINPDDVTVMNMGAVNITNQRDDGTNSGLVEDNQSIRIVPNFNEDGVIICPSATVDIIYDQPDGDQDDLEAPEGPQDQDITIMTSDQASNEPSNNHVREVMELVPVKVSEAETVVIRYLDFISVGAGVGGVDVAVEAEAKGAWARLTELYLSANQATTVDVYLDDGDGTLDGDDFKIADTAAVGTTPTIVTLSYDGSEDIIGNVVDGFVKDSAQGGSNVDYWIVDTGGAAAWSILGHADEDADQTIDPTYSGTGVSNPPKEGTVINVENPPMHRHIVAQLVYNETSINRYLDIQEDGIPIYYTTGLSDFIFGSPRDTDSDGQVEIELLPGTEAGNTDVVVCFPDPECTNEHVHISPGVANYFEVDAPMMVEAGDLAEIVVTIYDQYGNVISNEFDRPDVSWEILNAPGPDADLDDDELPAFNGDGDGFETEQADLGIGDADLQTSGTIGNHEVEVCVVGNNADLGCQLVEILGKLGQGNQIDCIIPDDLQRHDGRQLPVNTLQADQCMDVVVIVRDAQGNPLEEWESIVQIDLEDLVQNPHGETFTIVSTDLREEMISEDGTSVKGKLNNNEIAEAIVTICGCGGLGDFDLVCRTDTLDDDVEDIDVINSAPTCIDVGVESDMCGDHATIDTSIVDTCWNRVQDQECTEGGHAASCIALDASCGELSSDKTCVDLRNTGEAPDIWLDTSACGCGDIEITAVDEPDCCPSVYSGTLPMCDFDGDTVPDQVLFNKVGPVDHIDMEVAPDAENQDDFWVSELTHVSLIARDACGQEAICDEFPVDVELTGEDCVDTTIQVDSPVISGQEEINVELLKNEDDSDHASGQVMRSVEDGKYVYRIWLEDVAYSHTEFQLVFSEDDDDPSWLVGWDPVVSTTLPTYKEYNAGWGAGTTVLPPGLEVDGNIGDKHFEVRVPLDIHEPWWGLNVGVVKANVGGSSKFSTYPGPDWKWSGGQGTWAGGTCELPESAVHKIVIENCNDPVKDWTDKPQEADIVVDKIAFEYNGPTNNVTVCIWEENELEAGFQSGGDNADLAWECIDLSDIPNIPSNDGTPGPNNNGAWDEIHSVSQTEDGVYLIELQTRISEWNQGNEFDNQRLGGAVIEPQDTRDFYFVITGQEQACGEFDADYLYFQDYNSPDIVSFSSGHVRDTLENSEEWTQRNDDYTDPDPYPVHGVTPDYGFGDRVLHDLVLGAGAWFKFRDLVAETVNIFVDTIYSINLIDNGLPVAAGNQAQVTFLAQPATQVVARQHGDLTGDGSICDDEGFDPELVYDFKEGPGRFAIDEDEGAELTCRPAMACSDEGYDINLQVTDGFQNQVELEGVEVQLHSCLMFPRFLYLGDTLVPEEIVENHVEDGVLTIDLWAYLDLDDYEETHSDPWDVCYDESRFRLAVGEALTDYVTEDHMFVPAFLESTEFTSFIHSVFEDKQVEFVPQPGFPITVDAAGHNVVTTDANGQAVIRVESDDSSYGAIKSLDTSFRIFTVPHALDADYFDIAFSPGEPAKWDAIAIPEVGVPADGEQEAKILIRKTDACGNPVALQNVEDEKVIVTAHSDSGRAVISRDFSHENNYDNTVEGYLSQWSCHVLFPWFEDCHLEVLNDVIEDVHVTVEDHPDVCESSGDGFCSGPQGLGCETFLEEELCPVAEGCEWISEAVCQEMDSAYVEFVGAPTHLEIVEIKHSDLLPADGWRGETSSQLQLPANACSHDEIRECELYDNPDICYETCVQYGNSGAWFDVEIQDKFDNVVTTYLGDGFQGDPGDEEGIPDYIAEKICVHLDDSNAFIQDATFGWIHLLNNPPYINDKGTIYCGDLAFGNGAFKVVYNMLDNGNQPTIPAGSSEKVIVTVFDACDDEEWVQNGWDSGRFDDYCNAQEYNENNLPDSETASRLDPSAGELNFVSVADGWDIGADKLVVAADGEDHAVITIQAQNSFVDNDGNIGHQNIRTSLDATVQSSLIGSKLTSEAITPGCYVEGNYDPLNPTSLNVRTEACSGGSAELHLTSTKPGTAQVSVSGQSFGCKLVIPEISDPYVIPYCSQWGVIPLAPKSIDVQFNQAYQDQIVLEEGWNFFSVPNELAPAGNEWNEIGLNTACLASAMWDDNSQTFVAVPGTTVVEPLEGYWCFSTSAQTLDVEPLAQNGVYLPPMKSIVAGWNDVGLSARTETLMEHALISIDSIYTQVLDWAESLQRYAGYANTGEAGGGSAPGTTGTENMQAGDAYFVFAGDSGQLAGLS